MKCFRRLNGPNKTNWLKIGFIFATLFLFITRGVFGKKVSIEKNDIPKKTRIFLDIYNGQNDVLPIHLTCTTPDTEIHIEAPSLQHVFIPLTTEESPSRISCLLQSDTSFPDVGDRIHLILFDPMEGVRTEIIYPAGPRILRVTPSVLTSHQAVSITMKVEGFREGCEVHGNGTSLPILQREGENLTVLIPENSWPAWSLQIVCADGKKSNTVPLPVRIPSPTITDIRWNFTLKGEMALDIIGNGFSKNIKVLIDGRPVQSQPISTTRVQAWTEALAPGAYTVQLLSPDGSMSKPYPLRLNWEPIIRTIQPKLVEPYQAFTLILSGQSFTPGLTCLIGDYVLPVQFQSANLVRVQVPGLPPGEYPVIFQMNTVQFSSNQFIIINAKPRIERVQYFPNPAVPLARVTIEALAIDPEGDALTYEWSIVQGPVASMHPNGQRVEINLSNETGQLVVRLEVKDSAGNTVSKLVRIPVVW